MNVAWHVISLAEIVEDDGWHYEEDPTQAKLERSLREHGQLRPLVVRRQGTEQWLVDGRGLLRAMKALGWTEAMVADVGEMDIDQATVLGLALELRLQRDYARLAMRVALLLENGVLADSLARIAPLTADQAAHFRTLATFDWSTFREDEGQPQMDFAAPPTAGTTPPVEMAPLVLRPLEPEPLAKALAQETLF